MKNRYLYILMVVAILLLIPRQGLSQSGGQDKIYFKTNQLMVKGENVIIDCDIILSQYNILSDEQVILTPTVLDKRGNVLKLKPVIINGKHRDNIHKRMLALDGRKGDTSTYSIVRSKRSQLSTTIPYKTTIPLERWMVGASVQLNEDRCGCAGVNIASIDHLISGNISAPEAPIFGYAYVPHVQLVAPPREEIKIRAEAGEAYLTFKVGKWDILPDFGSNSTELAKIKASLEFVRGEPTAKVTGISIEAFASPEGSYSSNMTLSQNRAEALARYVRSVHSVETTPKGMGEDWAGLIKLVEADQTIGNKSEILQIIESISEPDLRDPQLKSLSGGRTYNYMLNTLYPYLRRSDYRIEYTVPSFTIEKGKELLKTRPGMLSVEEMYHIAGTYEKGGKEYNDLFDLALQIFPDDLYANLNAAAAALLNEDYDRAGGLLEKYADNADAWNNYGVFLMKKLRLAEARNYLERANVAGVAEARQNLEILVELQRAVDEFQAKKADYDEYRQNFDSLIQ